METVGDAAARLGASEASVKRWCQNGQLAATKLGSVWLIDDEAVPTPTSARPPGVQVPDLDRAITHLQSLDFIEIWVPDVLRFGDSLCEPDILKREVERRLTTGYWDTAIEVPIPKNPFFSRAAQLLTLEDRVAYHALVGSFADVIDGMMSDAVYSARVDDSQSKFFTLRGSDQWGRWRARVRKETESGDKWLIRTDLIAYFDCIRHDFLLDDLAVLGVSEETLSRLKSAFAKWSDVPGEGLVQGPDASRVLGNLFLLPIDEAMQSAGFKYFRYMDDIRIVADDRAEAVRAMRLLESECRKRALIVSPSKTDLLYGEEAKNADSDDVRAKAGYLFAAKRYRTAKIALRKMFRQSLEKEAHLDVRHARFSLWRLTLLRDVTVKAAVVGNLPDLAPIASIVGAYLGGSIKSKRTIDGITSFFAGRSWADDPYLLAFLFAAMLQSPGPLVLEWVMPARDIAKDRNQPPYLREIACSVLGKSPNPADITWLRREALNASDLSSVRAAIVGLARARALDQSFEDKVLARFPEARRTMEYLRGRDRLPSLVFAKASVPLV